MYNTYLININNIAKTVTVTFFVTGCNLCKSTEYKLSYNSYNNNKYSSNIVFKL